MNKHYNNYIDITNQFKKTKSNSYIVKELPYFEHNSKKYYVDGKKVVLDYSKKELETAYFLKKTFGGEIYMLPRVNKPEGIKTADYLWNNENWDLKEIKTVGKNVIDNRIHNSKNQSKNIIIDISCYPNSDSEIIKQIQNIYESPNRNWVQKIILIKNSKVLKMFKRKK